MKPDDPVLRSHIKDLLFRPGLTPHLRIYSWLSASVALYQNNLTRSFIELAFDEQIPVIKVKEIILQNYLFCGFPNAIEGLIVLNRVLHDRGLKDDNFKEDRDAQKIIQDGLNLCQKVYGKTYEKLIRNMEHVSSDISNWMVKEGYGKVLSRPILTPLERELSVISALAVLQRERQLISHIRGAVHVGATYEEIYEIISGLTVTVSQELVNITLGYLDKTLK
ncbi:carboxymuconolactone decarboxylase family protein [bacterium]|nr:MAG: carboxymuconolactone decarboxylase family protein [bacterium]